MKDVPRMSEPAHDLARDVGSAVATTVPPAAVWAVTLNEVVGLLTIAYILLQACFLIWRWRRQATGRHGDE